MKKGKILAVVIALALVIALSVTGTVAYLKTSTDTPVTNTFAAGTLFEDTGGITVTEHKATLDASRAGVYELDPTVPEVTSNTYTLVPGQSVPKDAKVNIKDLNVNSYVFVELVGTRPTGISYGVNYDNWTELMPSKGTKKVTGSHGGYIYCYKNILYPTADSNDFTLYVLSGNAVTVDSDYDPTSAGFDIEIYAYICQSVGYAGAYEAWKANFK